MRRHRIAQSARWNNAFRPKKTGIVSHRNVCPCCKVRRRVKIWLIKSRAIWKPVLVSVRILFPSSWNSTTMIPVSLGNMIQNKPQRDTSGNLANINDGSLYMNPSTWESSCYLLLCSKQWNLHDGKITKYSGRQESQLLSFRTRWKSKYNETNNVGHEVDRHRRFPNSVAYAKCLRLLLWMTTDISFTNYQFPGTFNLFVYCIRRKLDFTISTHTRQTQTNRISSNIRVDHIFPLGQFFISYFLTVIYRCATSSWPNIYAIFH